MFCVHVMPYCLCSLQHILLAVKVQGHEFELNAIASVVVGGLHVVDAIPHFKPHALIKSNSPFGEGAHRRFDLDNHRTIHFVEKIAQAFTPHTVTALVGIDGKVLDIDKGVKFPVIDKPYQVVASVDAQDVEFSFMACNVLKIKFIAPFINGE